VDELEGAECDGASVFAAPTAEFQIVFAARVTDALPQVLTMVMV
jgi:hypothetical protein